MSYIFKNGSDIDNDEYNILIDFDREKGKKIAVIDDDYVYRRDFRIGDVVTVDCQRIFGYVYCLSDDEVKVDWGYINEWENKNDLIIIPTEYGRDCLEVTVSNNKYSIDYDVFLDGWYKIINGYSIESNGNYLELNENKFNEVVHITFSEEKKTLIDENLNRNIRLYKDFKDYSLYRTNLFIGDYFNKYKNAFYIFDKISKKVYFGGIQEEVRRTLAILYSLKEN